MPGEAQTFDEGGDSDSQINCIPFFFCVQSVSVQSLSLPITLAVSTGRCNTGLQFTRRRLKAQGLSRALVETQRDLVEMGLSVDGQVGLL
ncbi:hypothetical protein HDF14_004444, partial [Edaphobacter lichenicola]|nr:hypothetical protein [Edaphobacter lichenicola]